MNPSLRFTTITTLLGKNCNSIGVEIDPEYCKLAAKYLKGESSNLFSKAELVFEKLFKEPSQELCVREDQELYKAHPSRTKLKT